MLLVACTVPSVSFAQVVIPCPAGREAPLDHVVPVATVSRPGDAMALADARQGDGFVLGAATLDLKDPACPRVAFTITNPTQRAIPWQDVTLHAVRVNAAPEDGALRIACSWTLSMIRWEPKDSAVQPGSTATLEMPIAGGCRALGSTVGFLVSIRSDGTFWGGSRAAWHEENARLRRAFETLRSQH
ncbi:MAG TPA: hypothetical protein VFX12_00295 [Vicinamibacterales bacterium]|nr:hypothetical protein [Vicinamibacterales bacterium]